jgi:hypothetical protein
VLVQNQVAKDTRFNAFVDNVSGIFEPYNVMLCPILVPQVEGDAGSTKVEGWSKAIGVVQFVNKLNRVHITEEDIVSGFPLMRLHVG